MFKWHCPQFASKIIYHSMCTVNIENLVVHEFVRLCRERSKDLNGEYVNGHNAPVAACYASSCKERPCMDSD